MLGIIPKFIIDKKKKIVQALEGQGIQTASEEQMFKFLELMSIMNGTDIIFSLVFPIFVYTMCVIKRIVPRPLNKTEFVITPTFVAYYI